MKIVVDTNETDIFAIQIFFYAGSVFESRKQHGLSHLLEHMLFKSKQDLPVDKLLMELNSLGGSFNAVTSKDFTSYYLYVHHSNWKHAIEMLNKIVLEPNFVDDELEKEKKVVIEEFLSYEDNTKDKIYDITYNLILSPQNDYAKSIKGNIDVIKSATKEQLLVYYQATYKNYMVYVNIPTNKNTSTSKRKYVDYIQKLFTSTIDTSHFGALNVKKILGVSKVDLFSNKLPAVLIKIDEHKQQNSTMISFCGFPADDSLNIVLDFLWDVLAGSLNSLLMMEMREKRGLVYGLSSYNNAYFTCGVTGVYFTSSSSEIVDALKYMFSVLKQLKNDGLNVEVFEYAKKSYINKLKYRLTDAKYKMERSMTRHYYECAWNEKTIQNRIENLQPKEVIGVCRKVFDFTKMCVVSIGKYKVNYVKSIESRIHKLILDSI